MPKRTDHIDYYMRLAEKHGAQKVIEYLLEVIACYREISAYKSRRAGLEEAKRRVAV
jgi:hypothetical protein